MAVPEFWKSTLTDVADCVGAVRRGDVEVIARSPAGREVYLVSYGPRPDIKTQATYNSACGAGNPAWYAHKPAGTPPTVLFLGPVHGQEVENIAGLVNLISLLETGTDLRRRAWPGLSENLARCRILIVPCANPDGRARCGPDSFVGQSQKTMAHWGQGSRADGTDYGWPLVKSRMPMVGDVGLLGAYHNDDGINMMHDNFFSPLAAETKAVLDLVCREAPDYVAMLHSHGWQPRALPTAYVPRFMKEKLRTFCRQLADRYESLHLPFRRPDPIQEDGPQPPAPAFNLPSAVHHACGAMAFTFECPHGLSDKPYPHVSHDQILDIQLVLYEELTGFALAHPVLWER